MANIIDFLKNLNILNIERAYKDLDTALTQLRAHAENAEAVDDEELEEQLAIAREEASKILAHEGKKPWDGMFREAHEYLAKFHMELKEYDEAEVQGRLVLEYDHNEGEYLLKQIAAHKRGERLEDFDPSAVDEGEE
jgi:hypothetical protein